MNSTLFLNAFKSPERQGETACQSYAERVKLLIRERRAVVRGQLYIYST